MLAQHICPRCRLPVAEERLKIIPFVCNNCGCTLSKPGAMPEAQQQKSDSRMMIALAGFALTAFILASSHVEMRWLQSRDFVGLSSIKSLERLAKVCTDLHKMDCVEHALARQAKFDPKRASDHAEFLIGRRKYKEAVNSMKRYIAGGKANARAYAVYARALAENGKLDEASKYFEHLVNMPKPSLEYVQDYVKYLTRGRRFDQALSVILRTRRTHLNALPVEYRVITELRGVSNNRVMASKR